MPEARQSHPKGGSELLNAAVKCFKIHRWRILSLPERDGEAQTQSCSLLLPGMQLPPQRRAGTGFKYAG